MRAAVLREYGVPQPDDFEEPVAGDGQALVEVRAAGLNPVDIALAAGTFYGGRPPLPSVAGREGVGMLDSRRVYFDAPVSPHGSMAQRTLVDPASAIELPDGVEDGVAVALGVAGLAAWLALQWRAQLKPGEHVLVLGASGTVGQIAVQAARLMGAARVVGAGRSEAGLQRSRELGADAVVTLGAPVDQLAQAFAEAADGRIDVVVDPLWGEPAMAAARAASMHARIVQLGQSAGTTASFESAVVRGKMLTILGHSNFAAPREVRVAAYLEMAAHAARGELQVDVERFPLERVAEAWERQQASPQRKLVIVP